MSDPATVEQEAPKQSSGPSMHSLVRNDLRQREHLGIERYGEPLQANNGRSGLIDAYQEVLDLSVYLRQVIEEGGLVGRHGADDSPADPLTGMTPGKLLARILDGDTKQRLDLCSQLIGAKSVEYECLMGDHKYQIEDLKKRVAELSRALVKCASGQPPSPDVLSIAQAFSNGGS